MKKIISLVLALALLCGCAFTLASCGNMVTGTYENGATKAEFSMGKVVITDSVEFLGAVTSKTYEAEYKIEENDDGEKTITFTYEDGADQHLVFNGTKTFASGEEDGTKYIKIGLIKYTKTK